MTTGLETLSPRFVPFSSLSENVFSSSRSRLPSWRNRSDNSTSIDLGEIPVEIRIVGWRKNWKKKKRIYIYNRTLNFHFRIRSILWSMLLKNKMYTNKKEFEGWTWKNKFLEKKNARCIRNEIFEANLKLISELQNITVRKRRINGRFIRMILGKYKWVAIYYVRGIIRWIGTWYQFCLILKGWNEPVIVFVKNSPL